MKPQEGEQILAELRPEPRVVRLWLFTRVLPVALVLGFITIWAFGFFGAMFLAMTDREVGASPFSSAVLPVVVVIAAALILGSVYNALLCRTYCYYITSQRVVFEGGLLLRVKRAVPYHKITDVEVSQNVWEQLLRIATLSVMTAGTVTGYNLPFGRNAAKIDFVGLADGDTPAALIQEQIKRCKATAE
jgi:membrane protein YdbS with pleckstrin-like domain